MVIFLSGDLLFGSRFHATAGQLGIETAGALSTSQALTAIERGGVTGVVVDLEASNLAIADFVTQARTGGPIRIVAYGPHVRVDRLAEARTAGCDAVLSRGEFDRNLSDLLQQLAQPM